MADKRTVHPKPRTDGETDAAYNKRVANWNMSRDRLKSVGIVDKDNNGSLKNATADQIEKFTKKFGHAPSGYKPKPTQGPGSTPQDLPGNGPTMDATNPSNPKPGQGGRTDGGGGGRSRMQSMGVSATGHTPANAGGFGPNNFAMGSSAAGQAARQGLSRMASRTGRRARRAMRQSVRRSG